MPGCAVEHAVGRAASAFPRLKAAIDSSVTGVLVYLPRVSYVFFSAALVSQWPRPPLTGHFQAICKRGDLRLSIQTIRRI